MDQQGMADGVRLPQSERSVIWRALDQAIHPAGGVEPAKDIGLACRVPARFAGTHFGEQPVLQLQIAIEIEVTVPLRRELFVQDLGVPRLQRRQRAKRIDRKADHDRYAKREHQRGYPQPQAPYSFQGRGQGHLPADKSNTTWSYSHSRSNRTRAIERMLIAWSNLPD